MKKTAFLIVTGAVTAGLAGAFLVGKAAGQEEQVSPTITELFQQPVSVNVQNADWGKFTLAVSLAGAEAAGKLGVKQVGVDWAAGPGDRKWQITLSVQDVRLGDLLRAVAALGKGDVYVKGPNQLVLAAPQARASRGVQDIPPLHSSDY